MDVPGYRIESELHRGEKYVVFLATRLKDNEKVTLKTFSQDPLTDYEASKLKQEFEISDYLSFPGIIQVQELETYRNLPVIVSEYFEGISLKEFILFRNLNLKDFLKISIELAQTIGEIHDRGVIHKDIKPSNIIVSKDLSIIKVTDFGISTRLRLETFHNNALESLEGTLAYISPEQTGRTNRAIDYRSDLYSLGVTLYELITGRLPFEMGDPLELLHSHIAVVPDSPIDLDLTIHPIISEIIMKLLEKNAEDRYQSAYGLKKDLEICLEAFYNNRFTEDFKIALGEFDFSGRLQTINKLYGRRKELNSLSEELNKIPTEEKKELLLITGQPGTGKSALITEFIGILNPLDFVPLIGKF
ncbi:MAG: serine/threonine-protein kinase PknK, partial [Leptospiraceae bacterium]|nr:serine/threonine-protein kinase PknK [Leptospiraceae bacterium]